MSAPPKKIPPTMDAVPGNFEDFLDESESAHSQANADEVTSELDVSIQEQQSKIASTLAKKRDTTASRTSSDKDKIKSSGKSWWDAEEDDEDDDISGVDLKDSTSSRPTWLKSSIGEKFDADMNDRVIAKPPVVPEPIGDDVNSPNRSHMGASFSFQINQSTILPDVSMDLDLLNENSVEVREKFQAKMSKSSREEMHFDSDATDELLKSRPLTVDETGEIKSSAMGDFMDDDDDDDEIPEGVQTHTTTDKIESALNEDLTFPSQDTAAGTFRVELNAAVDTDYEDDFDQESRKSRSQSSKISSKLASFQSEESSSEPRHIQQSSLPPPETIPVTAAVIPSTETLPRIAPVPSLKQTPAMNSSWSEATSREVNSWSVSPQKLLSQSIEAPIERKNSQDSEDLQSFLSSFLSNSSSRVATQAEKRNDGNGEQTEQSILNEEPMSLDFDTSIDMGSRHGTQDVLNAGGNGSKDRIMTMAELLGAAAKITAERPIGGLLNRLAQNPVKAIRPKSKSPVRKVVEVSRSPTRIPKRPSTAPSPTTKPSNKSSGKTPLKKEALNRVNSKFSRNSTTTPDTLSGLSAVSSSKITSTNKDKDAPLLKRKLAALEEENLGMRHELEQLRLMSDSQGTEALNLLFQLQEKEKIVEKSQNEVEYLSKKLRVVESDKSKFADAMESRGRGREAEGYSGDVSLGEIVSGTAGEKVTKEEVDQVRRSVEEQENLIRGYQHENEKLVGQVKSLSLQLRDHDKTWKGKYESLLVENTQFRNQILESENTLRVAVLKARAEGAQSVERMNGEEDGFLNGGARKALESELEDLSRAVGKRDKEILELKTRQKVEIDKSRVLEMEVQKWKVKAREFPEESNKETIDVVKEKQGEVDAMKRDMGLMRREYEVGARELEKVLERREGEVKEMTKNLDFKERIITEQESIILELRGMVNTARKDGNNKPKEEKRAPVMDTKRIFFLQKQVEELENVLRRTQGSMAVNLIRNAKKSARSKADEPGFDALTASQDKIEELEKEKDLLKSSSVESLTGLQMEVEQLKQMYERQIEQLEMQLRQERDVRADESNKKVSELEAALDALAGPDGKKVVEIQREMERLFREKQLVVQEFMVQMKEKEGLVRELEVKLRQKRDDEKEDTKLELERVRKENMVLYNRVEILGQTRKNVQESMISLLRQAQEEAARLALEHHDRALNMLREETKASSTMLIEMQGQSLKKQVAMAEGDASKWRARAEGLELVLSELKDQYAERDREYMRSISVLRDENSRLREDLSRAREAHSPEIRQFETLMTKVRDLETRFGRKTARRTVAGDVDEDKDEGEGILNRAAAGGPVGVRRFREDLLRVVRDINELKDNRCL